MGNFLKWRAFCFNNEWCILKHSYRVRHSNYYIVMKQRRCNLGVVPCSASHRGAFQKIRKLFGFFLNFCIPILLQLHILWLMIVFLSNFVKYKEKFLSPIFVKKLQFVSFLFQKISSYSQYAIIMGLCNSHETLEFAINYFELFRHINGHNKMVSTTIQR